MASLFIQPKLRPPGPSAELVMTLPWSFGLTATIRSPVLSHEHDDPGVLLQERLIILEEGHSVLLGRSSAPHGEDGRQRQCHPGAFLHGDVSLCSIGRFESGVAFHELPGQPFPYAHAEVETGRGLGQNSVKAGQGSAGLFPEYWVLSHSRVNSGWNWDPEDVGEILVADRFNDRPSREEAMIVSFAPNLSTA